MRRSVIVYGLALAALWVGQLVFLQTRLAEGSLAEYWQWRRVYRPGIQAVQGAAEQQLPGHTFNPLSREGATVAFVLSSGVYAVVAAVPVAIGYHLVRRRPRRRGRRSGRRRRS